VFQSHKSPGCSGMMDRPPSIMLSGVGRAEQRRTRAAASSAQTAVRRRSWVERHKVESQVGPETPVYIPTPRMQPSILCKFDLNISRIATVYRGAR
jgi:hypothetical protein